MTTHHLDYTPGPFRLKKYRDENGRVRTARVTPRWKIIIFYKGKRIIKFCYDPKKGQKYVDQLANRGIKAHVVCRRWAHFKPRGYPEDPLMLWCPYCRRWRYFYVTKQIPIYYNQGIQCCKWCWIPETDPEVIRYNRDWQRN
jgi:hypothetical protein